MTNNFNKFEFNTETEQCSQYIGSTKQLIPKELKMMGNFNHQVVFQLDKENKGYWINYTITFSRGKTWFRSWYKKLIKDPEAEEGIRFVHYQKKIEKDPNNSSISIQFDSADEMIKVWDEEKQKSRFVNRLEWENKKGEKTSPWRQ